MKIITAEYIQSISYTDFVGLINQWNVLPGSFTTLSKWISHARISHDSHILEIACTTGFSSREISNITGCSGFGVDISENSILSAIKNQETYGISNSIQYSTDDAYTFESDKKFSHIIVGAALKFFPDQPRIIKKIVSHLNNEGYLLASPFYVDKSIPANLIEKAKKVFGIQITTEGYKEVMQNYNQFEILFEERCDLIQETNEEIKYYAKCTIDRAVKDLDITDPSVYEAMFNRLVEVKVMSNELRPFQNYTVLVLRYRKNVYPNRFVELF